MNRLSQKGKRLQVHPVVERVENDIHFFSKEKTLEIRNAGFGPTMG
jgi:hypothetical protein